MCRKAKADEQTHEMDCCILRLSSMDLHAQRLHFLRAQLVVCIECAIAGQVSTALRCGQHLMQSGKLSLSLYYTEQITTPLSQGHLKGIPGSMVVVSILGSS